MCLSIAPLPAKMQGERNAKHPASHTKKEQEFYATRLAKMIQCKTVSKKNQPHDDAEFAALRNVMRELFPLVHEKSELKIFSDDCWVYKIEGKNTNRNVMLMSHHDVVEGTGEWKYPPFSATIADGKLWGRGTVDTKTPLFAEFSALEELLEEGFDMPCNIYIASSHNEEYAGDGIPMANKYFLEQGITFEMILDEGGAIIDPPIGGMKCEKCAMVAVHEKGRYLLHCTANAANVHPSLTAATNATATERMARFITSAMETPPFIRRLNPQVRAMFTAIAPHCKFPMNALFSNLDLFGKPLEQVMPKLNPQAGGMIGTTCTFTELRTLPDGKSCTCDANFKSVDGTDMMTDLEALRRLAKKYDVEITIDEKSEYHEPADFSGKEFEYMKKCIAKTFPDYPAIPFILPAGTDARTFTDICRCIFRFAPIRLSAAQLASVHSENENIDIAAIEPCVKFYKEFVRGL